ncbi:MAG: hypothetical protein ACXVA9_00315 [Bdellovibrionales bacterium]
MKQFLRWSTILSGAAICLLVFQNCSSGGQLNLESSALLGPYGHGATPPANAIAAISQAPSTAACPTGFQFVGGTGYLSLVCIQLYSASSTELVVDVKLTAAGVACPTDYDQVGIFSATGGNQSLCARSMPVKKAVEVVTELYEIAATGTCTSGDIRVGEESATTAICEQF